MLSPVGSADSGPSTTAEFVRRVCDTRKVWAAAGLEGLARVSSPRIAGRDVTLLWAEREQLQQWCDAAAKAPRIKMLSLTDVMHDVLPALVRLNRRVGTNWTGKIGNSELEPADLSLALRNEAAECFMRRVVGSGVIWMLEAPDGPGLVHSTTEPDRMALPCWSRRSEAEARRTGALEETVVQGMPLDNFLKTVLPTLRERNRMVAPEHFWGGQAFEISPDDLRFRLHPELTAA